MFFAIISQETEESEKMDEDSRLIEELRQTNEYQRSQISHLEKSLKQAISNQEDNRLSNDNQIRKLKDTVDDLNQKLTNCLRTIESKNVELLNLQTALGQYYAEIEAKVGIRKFKNLSFSILTLNLSMRSYSFCRSILNESLRWLKTS